MTWAEGLMLVWGVLGVAALGAWHLAGLLMLRRLKPSADGHGYLAVLVTFWGLLLLHFSEIVWCMVMLQAALMFQGAGAIDSGYGESLSGLVYLAGITFTTLGYTDQSATGPIRLLVMIQSLGGFMLLTWSATFVYSLWEERFR